MRYELLHFAGLPIRGGGLCRACGGYCSMLQQFLPCAGGDVCRAESGKAAIEYAKQGVAQPHRQHICTALHDTGFGSLVLGAHANTHGLPLLQSQLYASLLQQQQRLLNRVVSCCWIKMHWRLCSCCHVLSSQLTQADVDRPLVESCMS